MKKTILIVTILLPILLSAQTLQKNFIDQNYIEIIGRSEMDVVPDIIDIKIILNEKDSKSKKTLKELEKDMIDVLTNIGVDIEENLVVKDLTSNFKNFLFLTTDIILTKEYIVTVDEARKAALVFLDLQHKGISNVSIDKLDHTEIDEYKKKVKILAMKAAKDKAEALVSAIDQEIGRALHISEYEPGLSRTLTANVTVRGSKRKADSYQPGKIETVPNIEFESIKLRYTVLVKFELL